MTSIQHPQSTASVRVSIPSSVLDEWTDTFTEIVKVEVGLTPGLTAQEHHGEIVKSVTGINRHATVLDWAYLP